MYKLRAEFDVDNQEDLGDFENFAAAESFIASGEEEYFGADLVLTEVGSEKKWVYTDHWEPWED